MPHYTPPRRSATPPSYPYSHNYPGIKPFDSDPSEIIEASALVPYSQPADPLPAATNTAAKAGGGFSIPNLGDLKGMIDRMGGIDGIVATMGKVQKIMQTVQQFAPMAKMFTSLLPGAKGLKGGNSDDNLDEYKPRRKGSGRKGGRKGSKRSSSRTRSGKAPAKRRR
ncbi:hypothetical protein GCM10008933_44960 [Paenibacillus motobuensis]|uniref:Tyrosine protein kinase n=2 Tax=Paenibacillus motobuensis TaxID=295324 RepID=A0ABN0YUC9_9BACL